MSKNRPVVYGHPMSQIEGVLSTREAADILGITTRTVHRLAATGVLTPVYRLDGLRGALLFAEPDVQRLQLQRSATKRRAA